MPVDMNERIALFRYGVIAPLLLVRALGGALKRAIEELTKQVFEHPVRGPVRLGFGTIEEWLYAYKRAGLDGLRPAARRDRGRSRSIDDQLAEAIENLARDRSELEGPDLLAELRVMDPERKLPSLSSLYRFLRARGLDQRRAPTHRDHRAFAFDLAGDCWQGDIMYGPSLPTPDGSRRRTYLFAIIDDATRLVAHAQFYLDQHLRSLKDCLKQALLKRGVPRRLYLDNGKIFRSRLLLLVTARLGIHLLHSRPYQPQGRAKVERWFGTVRRSFLPRVDLNRLTGLDELNRLLFAWIEGDYHRQPHRGIDGETPLDRWMRLSEGIRPLPREVDLELLFLDSVSRRVAKDGTVPLCGRRFEVGCDFIRQRIEIRFDPFDLRRIFVVTSDGLREAFPVDLAGNRRVRRQPVAPDQPTGTTRLGSLDDLARRLEAGQPPAPKSKKDKE
jgi:putative transposase